MITRLIYLLLFVAPQVLIYLYLRDRLPDPTRPRQAHLLRAALATVFLVCNLPWLAVKRALGEISDDELRALQARVRPGRTALRFFDQVAWDNA